jgi:hypothetical protein
MKNKPTLFVVTDIETTVKHRIAFDVAWITVDRKGRIYDKGSYLVNEAFKLDIPYFKNKIGDYLNDAYGHYIKPESMGNIRKHFNDSIQGFIDAGHKVVFCAYNAAFDSRYLGETSRRFLEKSFVIKPIKMLDIWHFWVMSAPQAYNYVTPKGNPKTSAECVFRFENNEPNFVERHIAWNDCQIEVQILLKALQRKKKMPLVNHPSHFNGQPWRLLLGRKRFKNPEGLIVVEA